MKHKLFSMFVLLFMAVTGVWATVYNSVVSLTELEAGDVLIGGFSITMEGGQYILATCPILNSPEVLPSGMAMPI